MAKTKEFTIPAGKLWPATPSGNPLEIEIFGATGEFQSGKTILGLSIAPGKHPEGHPFAGKPRTLYLDFEKSGATYGGTGCERIDVPAELARVYGANYTAKQTAEWFNALPAKLKPGQYDVIVVDPANDIESGEVDIVRADPAKHGYTKNQFDNSVALLMAAMKAHWKRLLMTFSNVCKCFYFTTHLRDEFKGGKPSGKREPRGKETLAELASLYLWLERMPDEKGNVAAAPSAIVLKQRLADTTIDEHGNLVIIALMPPRIPIATVAAIRGYIANPPNYDKLTTAEKVIEKATTEEELCRLRLATAEAETRVSESRINLLDRQQQLTAIRAAAAAGQPQTPDRTAQTQQSAAEKRQAEGEVARQANAEAQAKLDAAKAEGERLLAAAQGDHATARDVAKEVQEKKTAATTPQPSDGSTERVNLFKSLLGQVGYLTDPIVKQNVDNAIQIRGQSKFSQLDAEDQTAINAWLSDLMDCRLFATQLGLDDAKLEGMLSRASIKRIEHLGGALAVTLRDKLKQAITARATAGQSGQAGQSGN